MKEVVVLIPIYKNFLEEYEKKSLEINLSKLDSYKVLFVAPYRLKLDNMFKELLSKYKLDVVYFENSFFGDIKGYNNLMLNYNFYKYFDQFNYILICQLDALILSNKLDWWVGQGFDFVGAPFICEDGENYFFNSMGNGGLSLRKISKFLEVLKSHRLFFNNFKFYSISTRAGLKYIILIKLLFKLNQIGLLFNYKYFFLFFFKLNEDYFWTYYSKFFVREFKIPSAEEALLFSFDVNPRKCFSITNEQLPFGCHAWQKYDRNFWEEICPLLKS